MTTDIGKPPRDIRATIRLVMTTAAITVFVGGVCEGLVQSNVQKWAEANGYDQYLVRYAGPTMDRLAEITQSEWFFGATWFFIGGALLLWVDYALRQRTRKMAIALLVLAIAIGGIATWILFHPVKQAEATQSSQSNISDAERAAIAAPFQAQIDELRRQIASIPRESSVGGYLGSRKPDKPVEREFTKRTVRELRAIYEGRTRLQADAFIADEKGKLIEADGTIVNVDNGMVFLQTGQTEHNGMPDFVECRFGPAWNAKLGTYRQNERMKIRGVIGPSQNGAQIYLQDCEIIG
jgi:hypothetical protein